MSSNGEDWTLEDFINITNLERFQEVGLKFGAQIGGKTAKCATIKKPAVQNFIAFDRVAKKS
jgi:hypothetical protein